MKFTYVVNNFLNRRKLRHNRTLYKKYGIRKSIYSPIGREDVAHISEPRPWLDGSNAKAELLKSLEYGSLSDELKVQVTTFVDDGFLVLKGFLSEDQVSQVNVEIAHLLENQTLDFNYTGRKVMESYKHSPMVDHHFFRNPDLLKLLSFLLGRKVIPFHTINFIEGSEQKAHSDSIHMATAPEGYMIAAWAALEATDDGNGPLFYYPGSHKLPYASCLDYESGNGKFTIGDNSYANYEDYAAGIITEHDLEKKYFHAEPGDLLIWHANLLHGGDPIREKGRTRKSMVAHYFGEEVLCFHEISQRPALLNVSE